MKGVMIFMNKNTEVVWYEFHNFKIPSEDYVRELVQDYIWRKESQGIKISKRKMGKEMGFSTRSFQRWLKGEHSIRYCNLEKIINYLVTLEEES